MSIADPEAPTRELPALDADDDEMIAETTKEGGSLLDRLKERRKALGERRTEVFDIPGYNGDLVARYKVIDWDSLKKLARKLERSKNPRIELFIMADTLILACDEILVRANGKLGPLVPDADEPTRYDKQLADALDMGPVVSAREALLKLFNNDVAVPLHHQEVMAWMQGASEVDDEDFLGESKGGAR